MTEQPHALWRQMLLRWEALIVFLLIVVVLGGGATTNEFLTGSNLTFLSGNMMEIAIMALPLTLVIISAEIDISIVSVLGLASALLGVLWNAGWAMEMIVPAVLVVGAIAGLFNGFLITRVGLPSLAVTIGTLGLYRGLAFVLLGDQAVADFPARFTDLGGGVIAGTGIPYTVVLFAVMAVGFAIVLHATPFGRSIYAIGSNEEAAFFSGIRVRRTKMLLFTLTGAVAALAGVLWTLRFGSARGDNGTGLELQVIGAVLLGGVSVFGGRGTIVGVIAAVMLVGAIRNLLTLNDVSDDVLTVVTGVLLIFSVLAPSVAGMAAERWRRRRLLPAAGGARP